MSSVNQFRACPRNEPTGSRSSSSAAGAVTVIYGAVVALRDPDRARFPSDWGPLEHGVAAAGLYTVGIAFQLYAVVT